MLWQQKRSQLPILDIDFVMENKLATVKSLKADVSGVNPSSERLRGFSVSLRHHPLIRYQSTGHFENKIRALYGPKKTTFKFF